MFDDDPRWGADPRDRDDARDRDPVDAREVFLDHVDLPRSSERQLVPDRERTYSLRDSKSRTLSTVGAFRVVSSRDLTDHDGRPVDPQAGDLRHLREQGLIRTVPLDGGTKDVAVVLTDRGRQLLESYRYDRDPRQQFYADLKKPREMEHDTQIYGAYLREAERLEKRGARIERVVLDYELKREYQTWLHERDRGRTGADGRHQRTTDEIQDWAVEHDLPYFDGHVHVPDLRIEYEDLDGRHAHQDVEIVTLHYRSARGAAAARSGFRCHGGSSARTGSRSADPDLADEFL
jgi:hypothetical protein